MFEAVPERLDAKRDALRWLDDACTAETVVASTTSTFLVTELAALTAHPERFLNAHWLNPASLIPLVEVSRAPPPAMPPPTSCWICCAWRARRR